MWSLPSGNYFGYASSRKQLLWVVIIVNLNPSPSMVLMTQSFMPELQA